MKAWTAPRIRETKGREKLPCLTASDYPLARLADAAGIPLLLVGDSLAMTVLGHASTLPATMDDMLRHTAAVARGASQALVVADMPFLSYQASVADAIRNAGRFLQEAGADAVKIEGGALRAETVRALVANGIPVLGHIGLTPQSVHAMGGYKLQGRTPEAADRLCADADALVEAGVFAIVLECIPAALGERLTRQVPVPTIGIGAGAACDGQVLVMYDLLGLTDPAAHPRFVKCYADLAGVAGAAFAAYAGDVRDGRYPAPEHTY